MLDAEYEDKTQHVPVNPEELQRNQSDSVLLIEEIKQSLSDPETAQTLARLFPERTSLDEKRIDRLQEMMLDTVDKRQIGAIITGFGIPEELAQKIGLNTDPEKILKSLGMLPHNDMMEFLNWYFPKTEVLAKELAPKIEAMKADFVAEAILAIADGQLPLTQQELSHRMEGITTSLIDPLGLLEKNDVAGFYSPNNNTIEIALTSNDEDLRKTVYHEFFHLVSGKTVHVPIDPNLPEEIHESAIQDGIIKFEAARVGLNYSRHGETTWLNEAVTEALAQFLYYRHNNPTAQLEPNLDQFLNQSRGSRGAYTEERRLLKQLLEQGAQPMSFNTILKAYFEDYIPEKPSGTRFTNRRKYLHELESAWEDQGLIQKLGKIAKTGDVLTARKELNEKAAKYGHKGDDIEFISNDDMKKLMDKIFEG